MTNQILQKCHMVWLGFALVVALGTSCGRGQTVAGGSPGETTNGIVGTVLDLQGSPLPESRVYLFSTDSMTKIDSVETDSVGGFAFYDLVGSHFGVEVVAQDSANMAWVANPGVDSSLRRNIVAPPPANLWVACQDACGADVHLLGTPYRGVPDGVGARFARVPAGTYAVARGANVGGFAELASGASVNLSALTWNPAVTLENFDDGNRRLLFAPYWSSSYWTWWLGLDTTFTAVYPQSNSGFTKALTDTGAYAGRSLHIKYQTNRVTSLSSRAQQWIGFRLPQRMDISELDSMSVWVRGNGKVALALETIQDSTDPVGLFPITIDNFQKVAWESAVDNVWRRVVFHVGDATSSTLATSTWPIIRTRTEQITLFFVDGTEIWVDDLVFYGIDPLRFALHE